MQFLRTRLARTAALALLLAVTGCGSASRAAPHPPRTAAPSASAASPTSTPPSRSAAPAGSSASSTPSPTDPLAGPSSAPPAVVVGLGDSVTAGSACECTPFIEVYTTMLGEHASRPVQAVNLGRGGLTTDTLATQLGSSATRARLARASQVVVTIGANDLIVLIGRWQSGDCDSSCVGHATAAMGHRLRATLATVHRETPPTARVLVTTYWNVFEDGDVADRDYGKGFAAWSDGVTRSANAQICAAARAAAQSCVDLYAPFEGDGSGNPTALLADDGDHPNAAGHRLIARTLLDAGGSSG